MFSALIMLAGLPTIALAQILSQDSSISWTCPDRSTIESAYYDYCPGTSNDAPLFGIRARAVYNNAPESYVTTRSSFDLDCEYQTEARAVCPYSAGGGDPLAYTGDLDDPNCPKELSQNVPQPSPGVNYRRRRHLNRRDTVGLVPSFTCPFNSDDPDIGLMVTEVRSGVSATENPFGVTANENQVVYVCQTTLDIICYYLEDLLSGVTYQGSSSSGQGASCPRSLCDKVAPTGSFEMVRRGTFLDGNQARVKRNQVDARRLRSR